MQKTEDLYLLRLLITAVLSLQCHVKYFLASPRLLTLKVLLCCSHDIPDVFKVVPTLKSFFIYSFHIWAIFIYDHKNDH